jgi:uncharacterized protein
VSVGLLDVNMLIALSWPSHLHHRVAHAWFSKNSPEGWATCPLTQCAFVRISSNPKIVPEAVTPSEALDLLRQIVSQEHHTFWPDDVALLDACIPGKFLAGHRQVTDAYLLGLAIQHGGRLVTLDRGVLALARSGTPEASALVIVGP